MMCDFDLVLFDLDGTLTNSAPGITGCVRRALEQMKWHMPPQDTLRRFIGPPLYNSFTNLCGMNPEQAQQAIDIYRVYYRNGGMFDNEVYDGVPEMLEELRAAGKTLAVATSKPGTMTQKVLSHFGLDRYFAEVGAADESDRGNGKEELILPVLRKLGVPASRAVMIGDTKFDASGARKSGTHFLGVLYGFGTEEEMRREGAEHFVNRPADIVRLLLDKNPPVR